MSAFLCFLFLGLHLTWLQKAQAVAGQFDAATTYNVDHNYTYVREDNPILRPFAGNPLIFPALAASDGASFWIQDRFRSRHPRISKALAIGLIGLHIYCGIHNLRLANSLPGWRHR